ncbi:hypothetical protein ACFO3J_03340 [Streptomyces polygonati]|jgi:hypothetical protein|uniref:Secreted protein n=1 Tax=Streptomyces polygonati TaxID=1617087 RepID=A0ABV8HEE8_9ACTN
MSIDWHALGTVLAVTLVATVGLVGVFTLGVVGLSRQSAAWSRTGACLCFAACAAAVAYGIDLIVG